MNKKRLSEKTTFFVDAEEVTVVEKRFTLIPSPG